MNIPEIEAVQAVAVKVPPDEDDDPIATAYSQVATQPLPTPQRPADTLNWYLVFVALLFYSSVIAGALLGILTYPTVTITLVPLEKTLTTTVALPVPARILAPVTTSLSLTTSTTGKGHIDAARAVGTLTMYNG